MKKYFIPCFLFIFSASFILQAGEKPAKTLWGTKNPFDQRVFIENKGQYFLEGKFNEADILFGSRENTEHYFFTKTGLCIMDHKRLKRTEKEIEAVMEHFNIKEDKKNGEEEKEFAYKNIPIYHEMQWLGSNPNVEVVAEAQVTEMYNYPDAKNPTAITTFQAHAYKKITYKNIYPNIDVEYTFPEDKTGYKYNIILHPGADASMIKMKYNKDENLSIDPYNNLTIKSEAGTFTDHEPIAQTTSGKNVECSFKIEKHTASFILPSNKITEETIIDPWVNNPGMTAINAGYDVDYDNAGNVYVDGGSYPYQIKKYTPAGVLLWTFTCSSFVVFSGSDAFYGDFSVDRKSGSVYTVEGYNGSGAKVLKAYTNGVLAATYAGSVNFTEMWRMGFSRCSNQAVIIGGGVSSPTNHGCYLDTNLTSLTPVILNGAGTTGDDFCLLAIDNYGNGYAMSAFLPGPPNMNSSSSGYSGKLLKLTLPGLLPIQYSVVSGLIPEEISSYYNANNGSGLISYAAGNGFNGITTSNTHVYTYDGYGLKKWNGANGALMKYKRVNLPPGGDSSIYRWSGITADDCDNIFVGSAKQILQYDVNLNLVNTYNMTDTVYDVMLGPGGKLYSTGKTFVSSAQVAVPPCFLLNVQDSITDASCTNPVGSATLSISGGTPSYTVTWNTSPVQTGTVVSNLPSGTYVATIVDNSCPPITQYDTVIISQSNGVSTTYTITNINCSGGNNGAIAVTNTGTVAATYTWSTGSNASSISNLTAGVYSLTVSSNTGCSSVKTFTVTQPPVLSYTLSPGTIKCFGDTTSIDIAVSGGTPKATAPTYTVAWNPPNAQGLSVHGLGNGNYGGFILDSMGCMATFTVGLTQPAQIIPNFTLTPACLGSPTQFTDQSAGGPFTWSWNFGDGTSLSTAQNPTHTYSTNSNYNVILTLTNAGGCSSSITNTLTVFPSPIADFVGDSLAGCPVLPVAFTDLSTTPLGSAITTWDWSFGNGQIYTGQVPPNPINYNNASHTLLSTFTVSLTVTNNNGCSSKVVKNNYLTVYPVPQAGFYFTSDDGNIIDVLNNNVHFFTMALGATAYNYNLGDIFANPLSSNYTGNPNPIHKYEYGEPYTYYITQTVSNQYGCKDSITEPLTVHPVCTFYAPNSFSPNGDGINEYFKGTGIGINNSTFSMLIFDRWGNQIFKANDLEKGWDGTFHNTIVMEDVYVWKVKFKDTSGQSHEYHGTVSIIK